MFKSILKYLTTLLLLLFITAMSAQDIKDIDFDKISDTELSNYWKRAQNEGYSLGDLADVARLKGLSEADISKLKARILSLDINPDPKASITRNENISETDDFNGDLFGLLSQTYVSGDPLSKKSKYFGYDFFTNPSISFEPNLSLSATKDYIVSAGDEITIDLWGATEQSYKRTISKDGNLQLPGSGKLFVSGVTLATLEAKVKSRLRSVFSGLYASENSPSKIFIDLNLSKIRNIQINVIGEVEVPGTYTLSGLSSVMNALYAAGGSKVSGSLREIKITRDGSTIGILDIYDYLFNGSTEGNIVLKDGDVIIVPPFRNRLEVSGEVKVPKNFEFLQGETINDVLNYSGGFTSEAYRQVLVLDRIEGFQRKILDIKNEEFSTELKDGDKLRIAKINDIYSNRVQIEGAVNLSGSYELKDKMTLLELVSRAEGFKEEAYLKKILLFRKNNEALKDVVSFDFINGKDIASSFLLKKEDSVRVFTKSALRDSLTLSITGAVNNPKTIDFIDKMRVTDIIALAGGFKTGADVSVIDVSRMLDDGNFETLSLGYTWESTEDLDLKTGANFFLKPYDRVVVRFKKGYEKLQNVTISGEVNFPGIYTILNKNERLSSLVERAGGLSPFAYLEGGTLIREKDKLDKLQKNVIKSLGDDLEENTLVKNTLDEYRIGIDLKKAILDKEERFDIILKEGDKLIIPSEKETVEVVGEIMSPSLIPYSRLKNLKDYIISAGGFSEKAKKDKVYVVHPNGAVIGTKRFLFFKIYPKVLPGSVVLVPEKIESRDKLSAQEIVSLTTGVATLAFIIDRLINN